MKTFKIEMGYNLMRHYELYKYNFDFLDRETFYKLSYYGKLGALERGKEIIIEEFDIHIKANSLRQMYYQSRKVPLPLTPPSETPLHN
ncbi:hypothetical protein [Winogradskyella sp. A2]|uniref:hypothetical protein n=1 Tax=Winogradskyella sp. A2 TaxID=3366944 RepID=UPI00398C6ED0